MAAVITDEDLLMAVLNSAPVLDGVPTDQLDGPSGADLVAKFGGTGTDAERRHLRTTRDALHAAIRQDDDAADRLASTLVNTALAPEVTVGGIDWRLEAPADERLGARVALAWSRAMEHLPGRLRPCANTECNLFLLDHSRPGTGKWCSMALCGNRMKARAHARRARGANAESRP